MESLLAAILDNDRPKVKQLLNADSALATGLVYEAKLYEDVAHWLYVGDTALHLAAAGHRVEIVRILLAAGSDPNAAENHRQSSPLHYAADGCLNHPAWDAKRQARTIQCLLDAGAVIDARDKNGATPMHRAVRTRCASAVHCLLEAGGDPTVKNRSGSTSFHLAVQNTGRGGTGAQEAKDAQRRIIELFLCRGIKTTLKDGRGKSVVECAKSAWIGEMLSDTMPAGDDA